jgi:hypothetical protein
MMNPNRGSLGIRQRVGHPQLDEGLTRDADTPAFSIDLPQQIDGEVDVDALDFAARTTSLRPVDIGESCRRRDRPSAGRPGGRIRQR